MFLGAAPPASATEEWVLGLARPAYVYLSEGPLPEDDGDVLVIEIDGKAVPTATEQELARRRRPRTRHEQSCKCQRHRGRARRERRGRKKRRSSRSPVELRLLYFAPCAHGDPYVAVRRSHGSCCMEACAKSIDVHQW